MLPGHVTFATQIQLQLRIACKRRVFPCTLRTIRKTVVLAQAAHRHPSSPPGSAIQLQAGQSVLLDPTLRPSGACLEVLEGVARVYCPCEETEGMTIAFLQAGDHLRTDRLCSEGVCVEALTPLSFCRHGLSEDGMGFDAVNEWTLQLLRIRHLGNAETRLHALLALLARRLGRRCGPWCDLPFRLTHERIAELIGTTRVTTTRLLSRFRNANLLLVPVGDPGLRLAPSLVESAPLTEG